MMIEHNNILRASRGIFPYLMPMARGRVCKDKVEERHDLRWIARGLQSTLASPCVAREVRRAVWALRWALLLYRPMSSASVLTDLLDLEEIPVGRQLTRSGGR